MQIVRRADMYNIRFFFCKHLPIIIIGPARTFFSGFFQARSINITNGSEFATRRTDRIDMQR